jgi:citrate lyase subunit beta/citryl-CoA lyase
MRRRADTADNRAASFGGADQNCRSVFSRWSDRDRSDTRADRTDDAPMRSLLQVSADDSAAFEAAIASPADVVVVDLTRPRSLAAKTAARAAMSERLAAWHGTPRRPRLFVGINGFASGLADPDLDAAVAAGADGIVLPKAVGGVDVTRLDAKIAVAEAIHGIPDGRTRIVAGVGDSALSVFAAGSFRGASHRLIGLAWSTAGLAADLGTTAVRDSSGALAEAFRTARTSVLLGAAAADVQAIDEPDDGASSEALAAAVRDGFSAASTRSIGAIAAINSAFTPPPAAVAEAAAIVEAFRLAGAAPIVELGDRLLERGDLIRALRLIERAGAA